MHYFNLVILCHSAEMFDFIHTYDLTCKYPHIYHSGSEFIPGIGCSNKTMDTRMHYLVSLNGLFFFPFGILLRKNDSRAGRDWENLSLSEA